MWADTKNKSFWWPLSRSIRMKSTAQEEHMYKLFCLLKILRFFKNFISSWKKWVFMVYNVCFYVYICGIVRSRWRLRMETVKLSLTSYIQQIWHRECVFSSIEKHSMAAKGFCKRLLSAVNLPVKCFCRVRRKRGRKLENWRRFCGISLLVARWEKFLQSIVNTQETEWITQKYIRVVLIILKRVL